MREMPLFGDSFFHYPDDSQVMSNSSSSPNLIDNSEENLRKLFSEQLQKSSTARIATGYFRLSGFAPLAKEIATFSEVDDEDAPVRILMGCETNQETADEINAGQSLREQLLNQFDAGVTEMEGNEEQIKQIDRLRSHIAAGRVALKIRDPDDGYFHAKGASFREGNANNAAADPSEDPRPATAVIGTSNFTQLGHVNNVELNLVTDDRQVAVTYESWFDSQWSMGTEATEDVLKIIEGNDTYVEWKDKEEDDQPDVDLGSEVPPFEMFKLLAYDELDGRVEVRETPLFEFQLTGYELARKRLNKYGGCVLSDSVGLGKSYIGSELLRDYRQEGKRCLLIVPANIEDQWASLLEKEVGPDGEPLFGLTVDGTHIKIMSISKFQNLTYHEANQLSEDFDVVLVDEGHRFRNRGKWKGHPPDDPDEDYVDPRRHANLRLFHENDMIILSATPVNNSAEDLKNLINLFTSAEELINKGGARLSVLDDYQENAEQRKELLSADGDNTAEVRRLTRELRDLSEGEIDDLLEEVLVQRNRNDIEDQISESEAEAFDFDFTPPTVHPEEYDLPRSYHPVYDRLPDVINALHLPHITIANEQSGGALKGLYKLSLFKRLESSTAAFVESVETIYDSERSLFNAIEGADDSLSIAAYADELVEDSEAATEIVHRTLEEFGVDAEAAAADAAALADGGVVTEDEAEDEDIPEWAADLADVTVGEVKTYIREDLAILANFLALFIRDIIADDAARREVSDGWAHLRDWLTDRDAQRIPPAEEHDVGAMTDHIYPQSDLEGIGEASERFYEAVFRSESFRDPKLGRLANLLNSYAGEEKVLIFTEFQTTAEYLHDALTDPDSAAPLTDRNSAIVTGNSKNKRKTVKRLAPEANNYTDAIEKRRDSEIDFVVATDTLSEGVNAQDVNVVINYDLPWNPTRIVQRVGRVDRIGSDEEKEVHNFFPDGDIEAAITLLERLQAKIDDIALLVGKENNILDPSEDRVLEQVGADPEKTISEAQLDEVQRGVERIREADTTSDYDAQSQIPLIQTSGATEQEAFNRILLRDYLTNDEGLGLSSADFEFADQYLTSAPEEREQLYTVVNADDVTQQRGVAALLHQWYKDKEAPQFGRKDRQVVHTPFGDTEEVSEIDDLRRIAPSPSTESDDLPRNIKLPVERINEHLEAVISDIRHSVRGGSLTGGHEDMPAAQETLCDTLDQIEAVYDLSNLDDPEAVKERASRLSDRLGAIKLTQHTAEYRDLTDRFGSDYTEWAPERVCNTVATYLDETIADNPDFQTTLEDPGSATGAVPCWVVIR
jgi:superfamily II DNA or RNA helicase